MRHTVVEPSHICQAASSAKGMMIRAKVHTSLKDRHSQRYPQQKSQTGTFLAAPHSSVEQHVTVDLAFHEEQVEGDENRVGLDICVGQRATG
jgi:hypothetical protein